MPIIVEAVLEKEWKIIYPKGGTFENQYIMLKNWKCVCNKTNCNCYVSNVLLEFHGYDEVKLGHRFVKLHNRSLKKE